MLHNTHVHNNTYIIYYIKIKIDAIRWSADLYIHIEGRFNCHG